jgi:hypothetical protein
VRVWALRALFAVGFAWSAYDGPIPAVFFVFCWFAAYSLALAARRMTR